jgi:hypothetical protein
MPPAKKIPIPEWMRSDPWKTGDILSYKITHKDLKHAEYSGKYVLLRVVDMILYEKNDIYLAYYSVFNWYGDEVPNLINTNELSYLKLREQTLHEANYSYSIYGHITINKKISKTMT